MTQPGESSQPEDTTGDGPVTLEDRTEPGGQGSPDTNQAKAEPTPADEHASDPRAPREPPSLASMNVGAGDPQAPSHPAAGRTPEHRPEAVPASTGEQPGRYPADDPTEHQVADVGAGAQAMHQGQSGTAPLEPGAARPGHDETGGPGPGALSATPGDAAGVIVPSEEALPGSSEEQCGVGGVRP